MFGGDALATPSTTHRPFARLLVVSGRTGRVLQANVVPDWKESYYSPQVYIVQQSTAGSSSAGGSDSVSHKYVLFGTGGETVPGSLYRVKLDDVLAGNIGRVCSLFC